MKFPALTHPTPLELKERKEQLGWELRSSLFLSEGENKIIVVPLYLIGSLTVEQERPEVLPFRSSVAEIGRRAKKSLMKCENAVIDLRNRKESDWPAYQASKAKSLKAFKASYVYVSIGTINANLRLEAHPISSEEIFVGAYIFPACSGELLGKLILQMYRCCQQLDQLGLVRSVTAKVRPSMRF